MVRGWQKRSPRSARFQKLRYWGNISNRASGPLTDHRQDEPGRRSAAKLLSNDEARRTLSEVHDEPPQRKAKEHNQSSKHHEQKHAKEPSPPPLGMVIRVAHKWLPPPDLGFTFYGGG
jgi:hypothetical protein